MHSVMYDVAPSSEVPNKGGKDVALGRCQAWVDLYDAMHPGPLSWGDDRELYLLLAREAYAACDPHNREHRMPCVLELGVGTGRVATHLAKNGCVVAGVDLSPKMLKKARQQLAGISQKAAERVRLIEGDMREFEADDGPLELAIIPFSAFQALCTVEDQEKVLQCVRRYLRPGGRLAIDIFDPRLEACVPGAIGRSKVWEGRHPVTGRTWKVFMDSRKNVPEEQLLHEDWRFVELGEDGEVMSQHYGSLTLRWTYRYEMQHLLERSGFDIMHLWGDYERGPFVYGKRQVWLARKV